MAAGEGKYGLKLELTNLRAKVPMKTNGGQANKFAIIQALGKVERSRSKSTQSNSLIVNALSLQRTTEEYSAERYAQAVAVLFGPLWP